jgi:hypothetical protein
MPKPVLASIAALVVLAGCSSIASPSSGAAGTAAATAVPVASSKPPETPSLFTSTQYPYSVMLPYGWHAGAAIAKWDGVSQPGSTEPTVDKFGGSASASAFAMAAATNLDLTDLVKDRIAANFRDHGDTCPKEAPDVNQPTTVGDDPAVFLAWNCGILINMVITVHDGLAFLMVMRDVQVHAATDPADRALLDALVSGVRF